MCNLWVNMLMLSFLQVLKFKHVVVNRAPIMMTWAFVVAERLGFQREEALSIGEHSCALPSVYITTGPYSLAIEAMTRAFTPSSLVPSPTACLFSR
jgi:hypothetical protein